MATLKAFQALLTPGVWSYQQYVPLCNDSGTRRVQWYYTDLCATPTAQLALFFEIDENQHRGRACENIRVKNIAGEHGVRSVYVRLNTDGYKVNPFPSLLP